MTIVELVDAHDGFAIITQKIKTQDVKTLMWLVALLTFFMSAVLDNLTTAIVMVSLLRKSWYRVKPEK
jgi:Na+/H+ antiporter NhaD/arsenite permease-like protein